MKKSVLLPVYGEAQGTWASGAARTSGTAAPGRPLRPQAQFGRAASGLQGFPASGTEPKSELDHNAQLSIVAPTGCSFIVCPYLPFVVESGLAVTITAVKASNSRSGCIEISGTWRRSHWQSRCEAQGPGIGVKLTLGTDRPSVPVPGQGLHVITTHGAASLQRCAAEKWVALQGDGHQIYLSAAHKLRLGSTLLLQRPRERVYVLRNPEEQLSRLIAQLSAEKGMQVLAAPASGGAVAAMAACKSSSGKLIMDEVLAEIEQRFSVVFVPERAAENIPATKATDAILRRLVAFAVRHSLRRDSWQSAEFPYRLFQSQSMSNAEILQRPSLRVPCVDVGCDKASSSCSQIAAELRFSAAVRLVQPLAPFLARSARSPELAGSFCLQGSEAIKRPPIHVLPRLTAAQITHIWQDGQIPKEQLPPELQEVSAFSDYWRLIHGHILPEGSLASFARVQFLGGDQSAECGLVLTYPVSCLWRTFWSPQPALSRQHGAAIVKQILQSLSQNASFGTWHLQCGGSDVTEAIPVQLSLNRPVVQQDVEAKVAKPVETGERLGCAPSARKTGRTGKRRLILPLVQPTFCAAIAEAGPAKRHCVR